MATTYGSFPGVQITVAGGGITSVAIGESENLVLFGAADYQNDGTFTTDGADDPLESSLSGSPNTPVSIDSRRQADSHFGADSRLANGMREALANGANINYLQGVAPQRINAIDESLSSQTGTLDNFPIAEELVDDESNLQNVSVEDVGAGSVDVEYTYETSPAAPSATDTMVINPNTGDYAADAAPDGSNYTIDYKYLDWDGAFTNPDVREAIGEDETGVYCALTDADSVSIDLSAAAKAQRDVYKLVTAMSGAEPNDNDLITSNNSSLAGDHSNYQRRDARYNTTTYGQANQSVDADYYFKFAPVREADSKKTILGGIGGLFAGNSINDPIYNDQLTGYTNLEQSFSKLQADDMRDEHIIPVRQAGSVRVKDNLSTSTDTDWERDFWRRRIADRVVLIGKMVGESIIGQINDPNTRGAAERLISQEVRSLVEDRLLKPNTQDDVNWYVDVYEDGTNKVNIDIGFTPYGIVKQVEETITINT